MPVSSVRIITHYLDMCQPPKYASEILPQPVGVDVVVAEIRNLEPEAYRDLYRRVGEPYFWLARLMMSDKDLIATIQNPGVKIYVLYVGGKKAGYAELLTEKAETEIVHFGLFLEFQGQGWGRYFLRWIVIKAWQFAPKRVWLHTCVLDGKWALHNYKSQGFAVCDTKWDVYAFPDTPQATQLLENLQEGVQLS
jgi:GNAT superfamily N-acetyltransferase